MNHSSFDLSLVLACYNEEPLLLRNVQEILTVLDATRLAYELIFVDDASTDRTKDLIEQIVRKNRESVPIRAIFHEKNIGRGGAVRDGFLAAQGDMVGYLDVDLEIPASVILPCLLALRQGHDVAVGKRIYKFRWRSIDRSVMSRGYAWLVQRALRLHGLTDTESGCKFFRRNKVLPLLKQCQDNGWFWDTEIMTLAWLAGLSIVEIPCLYFRRFDRASSVRPLRDSIEYFAKLLRFRARVAKLRTGGAHLDESNP